jgi:hypothetical protein
VHAHAHAHSHSRAQAKWSLTLLGRVLKEGVHLPSPPSIADLLDDPRLKAMVDARLVGAARSVNSAQLRWPNITPPIRELTDGDSDGACLPAPSTPHQPHSTSSSSSPSTRTSTSTEESSLDDMLQSLEAYARTPDPPSPALEYERWLL